MIALGTLPLPTPDGLPAKEPGTNANEPSDVRQRCVFYLSGFDPSGPSRYHQIYSQEAVKQARCSGYRLAVGRRRRLDEHRAQWELDFTSADGTTCHTQYQFLRWDDIVRRAWVRSPWLLAWLSLASLFQYLANGSAWRVLQTSWPAFICLISPGVTTLLCWLAVGVTWPLADLVGPDRWGLTGELVVWSLMVLGIVWMQARLGRLWRLDWLTRSASFILRQARGQTPDLEQRLDLFGHTLASAIRSERFDEVLVVGHSSGAMLAISVIARAMKELNPSWGAVAEGQQRTDAANLPQFFPISPAQHLSLLTLGHCMPLLSYQPQAQQFREELDSVRRWTALHWVDISALADGCSFALTSPCEVLRQRSHPSAQPLPAEPQMLSARFASLFKPETYRRLRSDRMKFHFQYLMATELIGSYDFFRMTAGVRSLSTACAPFESLAPYRRFRKFGSPCR